MPNGDLHDDMADERDGARDSRLRRGILVWPGVAGVVAIFALVAFVLLRPGTGDVESRRGSIEAVPRVSLTDFQGEPFTFAQYRGIPLVVNFWASWCPFCAAEMPDFEKVHRSLEGRVGFVGIAQRDDFRAANSLADKTGVTYRLVGDPDGLAYDAIAAGAMPTTAFIDEEGNVLEVVGGMLSERQLRELISQHFGLSE